MSVTTMKPIGGAERRKLETHPTTGAAQLVELREVIQEIAVPVFVEAERAAPPKPPLFPHLPDDQLLGYGVPVEWLEDVKIATEDNVLDLADHLPAEAAEALLELAVGKTPQPSLPATSGADPFSHPDALRRFRIMNNMDEFGGGPGISLGEVDGLSPPGPARPGGEEIQWSGKGFRLGRHRQDRRSSPSSCVPD